MWLSKVTNKDLLCTWTLPIRIYPDLLCNWNLPIIYYVIELDLFNYKTLHTDTEHPMFAIYNCKIHEGAFIPPPHCVRYVDMCIPVNQLRTAFHTHDIVVLSLDSSKNFVISRMFVKIWTFAWECSSNTSTYCIRIHAYGVCIYPSTFKFSYPPPDS